MFNPTPSIPILWKLPRNPRGPKTSQLLPTELDGQNWNFSQQGEKNPTPKWALQTPLNTLKL